MNPKKTSAYLGREICPPGFGARWQIASGVPQAVLPDVEKVKTLEQGRVLAREEVDKWIKAFREFQDGAFKENVYENPKATQLDFRQHRKILVELLSFGERVAFDLSCLRPQRREDKEEIASLIEDIDRQTTEILEVLFQWHGPIENDSTVPDSLKQSMREVAAGETVPLDI